MKRLVLGTRGSRLARRQAAQVAELLRARHPGLEVAEHVIATEGDVDQAQPVAALGATGVWVRAIETALAAGVIDVAVHSLKDLPTDQPTGLVVAAMPERRDPRDAIVSEQGWRLSELPAGAVVGTGSVRRACQLLHARPDLRITAVRGNVDTRLQRLREGRFAALALAVAGLERLGVDEVGIRPLDVATCVPAVGQGALALEVRMDDVAARELVEPLSHAPTIAAISAERAFLRRLGGGCQAPAAAHAELRGERIRVRAMVGEPSGRALLVEQEVGDPANAAEIGRRLAQRLRVAGAEKILAAARDPAHERD